MKITKLVIYGYGKWIDTEFSVSEDWHLFYGPNEAGKSTLMSFIHSILFGFPKRHSSSLRYEPKESSRYGGKVILLDERFGEVTVERISGKVTGDVSVTLEDGTQGGEAILDTLLYHKKRHFYESIYTFNLKGVEETSSMSKDQLNRFFLSTGSLGSEQFLKLSDSYKQKAGALFKPTGRKPVINQLQGKLAEVNRQVSKARERNAQYTVLRDEVNTYAEEIDRLNSEMENLQEEKNKYISFLKHGKVLREISQIRDEIEAYPSVTIPENGKLQLKHYNEQLENIREQIKALHEKQNELQKEFKPSPDFVLSQELETDYQKIKDRLDELEDKVELISREQHQLSVVENQIVEMKLREGYSLKDSLPKELTDTKLEELSEFKNVQAALLQEETAISSTIQELKIRTESNNERIDSIEKDLWPLEKFKAEQSSESSQVSASRNFIKDRAVITALVFLITGVIAASLIQNIIGLTVLILLCSAALYTVRNYFLHNRKEQSVEDQEKEQLFYQKSMRSQWKELLALNDSLQDKRREQEILLEENRRKQKNASVQFEKWKEKMRYPQSYTLEKLFSTRELFTEMKKLTEKKEVLENRVASHLFELDQWLKGNEYASKIMTSDKDISAVFYELRNRIRAVESEKNRQKDYIQETNALQEAIRYLVKQEKDALNKKYKLFSEGNVESEEDFLKLYQLAYEKQEKQKRYDFLKETIEHQSILKDNYTIEEINEQIHLLEDKITSRQVQITEKTKEKIEIGYRIKQLEEGGTYSELLQQLENEKSVYQKAVDEWCTLKVASDLIEKTLKFAKDNQLPKTLSLAEEYFADLTAGHYVKINLESDSFYVTDKDGRNWEAEELSRGTVEPLYIAVRLAFVYSNRDSIHFPIIIDDSFVNMDKERRQRIYGLLNTLSRDIQIIYFSFDSSVINSVPSTKLTRLMDRQMN